MLLVSGKIIFHFYLTLKLFSCTINIDLKRLSTGGKANLRTLILYHSGVGSTKFVATLIAEELSACDLIVDIYSIEEEHPSLNDYDFLCIGFPTYHASPSTSITNFINHLPKLTAEKPTFIFTTCGLYSANTLRIFSKQCLTKNLIPVYHNSYRGPASDGTLLFPSLTFMQTFQKKIAKTIKRDVARFLEVSKKTVADTPNFKLYAFLNFPNKLGGQFFVPNIYLNKEACIRCKKCVLNCPHNCFTYDVQNFPVYQKQQCESCYRCIHHCPKQALNISKKNAPKKQLNHTFFKNITLE